MAAIGVGAGISAVGTILDDLVTAFKTVFNNIYRFAKPGWVITFAAGAPIALKYIDQGIDLAEQIAAKWADTLHQVAANIYEEVYKWVTNKIGTGLFQSVAASFAAGLAAAPIWLAAIMMQYVVQPLVRTILEALKQIFNAVYDFVCKVLVPVVRIAIAAYVSYYSLKGMYRHIGSTITSWFSSSTWRTMGKTFALITTPLVSGFLAQALYEHILNMTGACGRKVTIQIPSAPAITPATTVKRVDAKITVTDLLSASILPSGVAPTSLPYVVPVSESLKAEIQTVAPGVTTLTYRVNVSETLSAEIKALAYTVNVTETLSAEIKGPAIQTIAKGTADALGVAIIDVASGLTYEINVTETLSAEISALTIQTIAKGTADALGITTVEVVTSQTIAKGTADALGVTTVQVVSPTTTEVIAKGTADALGVATIQITTAKYTADLLVVATTRTAQTTTGQTSAQGAADALGVASITVQ